MADEFICVETARTRDYQAQPQEYGGFSLLSEADRQQILVLIFGDDGLRPGIVKMFLDPFHMDVFTLNEIRHNTTTALDRKDITRPTRLQSFQ